MSYESESLFVKIYIYRQRDIDIDKPETNKIGYLEMVDWNRMNRGGINTSLHSFHFKTLSMFLHIQK